jgi:hypothetical protein
MRLNPSFEQQGRGIPKCPGVFGEVYQHQLRGDLG